MRENTSVVSVEESMLWGKRNRDAESVTRSVEIQTLHKFLELQAESAVPGEHAAQRRLTEAETDMEIKGWYKKDSEIALYES